MCTATWLYRREGYRLFFNRDELRSRAPARAAAARERDGATYLAPRDGEAGGTWIAVNARGLILCLLNGASGDGAPRLPDDSPSRGLIVDRLATAAAVEQVAAGLDDLVPSRFRPFALAVFSPGGPQWLATWDGRRLTGSDRISLPLVSSSFRGETVRARRIDLFRTLRDASDGDPIELHRHYHACHLPERGPFSPCMHRPEARTVSHTEIVVDARTARMIYTPGPPCSTRPLEPVRLPLAQ